MKTKFCVVAMACGLMLAACSPQTGAPVVTAPAPAPAPVTPAPTWVSRVQTLWTGVKEEASLWAATHPADAAAITKAEGDIDPEVAALSRDAAPTTIAAVVNDVSSHALALRPGILSKSTMDAIALTVFAADSALLFAPPPAAPAGAPAAVLAP